MIFQHYQLLAPLSVYDNIVFQAQLNQLNPKQSDVDALAERLGILHKLTALLSNCQVVSSSELVSHVP